MRDINLEGTLRASPLFAGIDENTMIGLGARAVRRRFTRGEAIWRARQPASQISVIRSGLVKIVRFGDDGATSIVSIFGPHEVIGLLGLLTDGVFLADAIAASSTVEVASIDAQALRAAMDTCPVLTKSMNRELASLSRELDEKIQIMSAGTVERRLAALLLHMFDRFGDELEGGTYCVPVSLTRIELASLVGATVETTIRTMSRWHKSGVVRTTPDGFMLDDLSVLRAIRAHARTP